MQYNNQRWIGVWLESVVESRYVGVAEAQRRQILTKKLLSFTVFCQSRTSRLIGECAEEEVACVRVVFEEIERNWCSLGWDPARSRYLLKARFFVSTLFLPRNPLGGASMKKC